MSKRIHKQATPRRVLSATPAAAKLNADLQNAVALHQRGQLVEAEQLYRNILKVAPDHSDSHHLLGVLKHQQGQDAEALELINAALQKKPNEVAVLSNYGAILNKLKRFDEALANCDKAIALRPDYVDAFYNRGFALGELKRFDEALASYDNAIALKPDHAAAFNNRGNILNDLKRHGEALTSFDQAIVIEGNNAAAFYNCGIALKELKHLDEALTSHDRAIALKPNYAEAFGNRGDVLRELKRFEEALASYDKAIALKPVNAAAFNNRGVALAQLKRFDEALASCDTAIAFEPDYAAAFNNRGNVLRELKRFEEALTSCAQAIALKPDYAEAFNNRGISLQELKRFDEALASYDRAIALNPDNADALNNRGNSLKKLKRLDEALASYEQTIILRPDSAEAFYNRGNVLEELKRFDEALESYDKAIAFKPDYADAFYKRGNVLANLNRLDEALASFDKVIALKPNNAEVFNNRGNVFANLKRLDDALASYDRAIALKPDNAVAFNNRGNALQELRRFDEALASYDKALAIKPDDQYAFSGIADCARKLCDWTRTVKLAGEIKVHVAERKSIVSPFMLLGYCSDAALHLKCAQIYAADKCPMSGERLWRGERYAHERIRVAYISADFRDHPVAYLLADLFEQHNRTRFETIGIALGPNDQSAMRARLKGAFERFIDVRDKSDRDVAGLMRELEVDIAVDLMGFTSGCRPTILALRPAPIQVNYLGYAGTMGADHIDYIVADRLVIPENQRQHYSEQVVYLPDTYMGNDSKRRISDRTPTRTELGLPETGFVFCSFNNSYKITPHVFEIWMRLLREIAGSVLWLSETNASTMNNLRREAEVRGVRADRLIFAPRMKLNEDHLARQRQADLFLDTLPYNAHATASDALWAGLPVVTCLGSTFVGRVAASLLNAVGLPELITHSAEQYEALALKLARDAPLLANIKAKLARHRDTYPLFNSKRFTRHLEAAYTTMWEIWQRGESRRSFSIALKPNSEDETNKSWGRC